MCAEETKTLRITVSGLVQGVGYRAFVTRAAAEMGIRGAVRNLPDGDVEVVAQAGSRALEKFLLELRRGPRMARVQDIRVESVREAGSYSSFDIRW
ncbi:MAG: acylphosphatase [Actinobacteria bacterium]|nr:MAG: acylphosphatase [Actinomycetota bacterium]